MDTYKNITDYMKCYTDDDESKVLCELNDRVKLHGIIKCECNVDEEMSIIKSKRKRDDEDDVNEDKNEDENKSYSKIQYRLNEYIIIYNKILANEKLKRV